jgi:predicted O-methyltransferase YrrM
LGLRDPLFPHLYYLCEKRTALKIIDPLVQSYSEKYSSDEDQILAEINLSSLSHPKAHMQSGPVQGKFLEMISLLKMPHRILDIGTFMGYSAVCLAKGLAEGGKLHTIECRPEQAQLALGHFRKANMADKIISHLGNALDIIPGLTETWDLVYIDADKTGYTQYYQLLLPRVRSGGLIIADNVLFYGEVLGKEIKGKNARSIHAFNEVVKNDESVDKVLLTVRDGLLLIRKK